MNNEMSHLRLVQLDKKMAHFTALKTQAPPGKGWIHAIRTALGMSLLQLGKRLKMTPQGVKDIERRENDGSITIQKLREVAANLDMQLVYGLVPKELNLEKLIEKRAYELAREIVLETSHHMKLENQGLTASEISDAIERRAKKIINEIPNNLWS